MTFGCWRITYIPHLLWWFTAMNLTSKMLHKCSVLLIMIIQRILRWINSSSFLQQLWSPFYSACSFYSLLIKCDFLSGCLYLFYLSICLNRAEQWASHPAHHFTSLAQLHSPLCCVEPSLEKVTALEKHWREVVLFRWSRGANHGLSLDWCWMVSTKPACAFLVQLSGNQFYW